MPDDDKTDGQVALLGAPLTAGEQLYLDLQSLYIHAGSDSAHAAIAIIIAQL